MARPTPELVERVMSAVRTAADLDYFFDNLTSPEWIEPLRDAGMFSRPPEPIRNGDLIQLPAWSASRYLVRMAPLAPEIVAETMRAIPATENGRVLLDLVDAVIAMPGADAAGMAQDAIGWVQAPMLLGLPSRVGELLTRLVEAGATEEALALLAELLRLDPPESEDTLVGFRWGVQARMRPWEYQHLIETSLPALLEAADIETLAVLIRVISRVLGKSSDRDPDYYSWSWRSAIEDHEQNNEREQLVALISAIRDAAEHVLMRQPDELPSILSMLANTGTSLGERLRIHLVRMFAGDASPEFSATMVDASKIGRIDTHHEYWLLLQDRFANLDPSARSRLLDLIETGPSFDGDTSEEDQKRYRDGWVRRYLAAISGDLTEAERKRLDDDSAATDAAWHPEFLTYMTSGFSDSTSPLTADEIGSRSVEEIIEYIATWEPGDSWTGPTPEGLARALASAVVKEPSRFAAEAVQFAVLDSTYVRGFLEGFREVVSDGASIDWHHVLSLATHAVGQADDGINPDRRLQDADSDWSWARSETLRLLAAGLKSGDSAMPPQFRERVWQILAQLAEDPQPDAEYEAEYGGSNMDPTMLSLNTVRGQAFGAILDYMVWVRREMERVEDQDALDDGFDAMPEVRAVLERHLSPEIEPSAAVHSVYGRMLPWLVLVDEAWVRGELPRIFPEEEALTALRDAAWVAYIHYCRVYDSSFEVLRDEYRKAVDRLPAAKTDKRRHEDPNGHLGEHLMIQYWRGKLDLDPGDLIQKFFQNADDDARAAAFGLIGRSLEDAYGSDKPEAPQELVARLQALWEWRISSLDRTTADTARREIGQFGWWYGSGAFEPAWALPQLASAVRLVGSVEGEHKALKGLVADAGSEPLGAARALEQLVHRDSERWLALGHKGEVRAVLRTVLDAGVPEAREVAINVVHELGTQGFREYRDLLTGRGAP